MNINEQIAVGDRIRCLHMADDPDPIPVGSEGVVTGVADLTPIMPAPGGYHISVRWDSGCTLALCEKDQWEKIA